MWKSIFLTGAFGGIAPILLQIAIDLTQGRKRIEAIGLSIIIGMAIYAILGGGISLIWKETDLKKVFYIGLGLPSLLTIASGNLTAPQPPSSPVPAPIAVPQQGSPKGPTPLGKIEFPGFLPEINQIVYAQNNVVGRQLVVDLITQSVPPEITQSPLYIVFEPTGTNVPIQYGQAMVDVPPTATAFHIEGSEASSDSVQIPAISGSTTRIRFAAQKRFFYGLLYSLGIKAPPFQLVPKSSETSNSVTTSDDPIAAKLTLAATDKVVSSSQDGQRFAFSLSVNLPEDLKEQVSKVEYDLEYASNPLWLTSTDPKSNFGVNYEGWGCYRNVDVTVFFKDAKTQPRKKRFNMCSVLEGE